MADEAAAHAADRSSSARDSIVVRPWKEFVARFQPPDHLQARLDTNFYYYRGNYFCIGAFLVLAVPATTSLQQLLAVVFCLVAALYCVQKGKRDDEFRGSPELKAIAVSRGSGCGVDVGVLRAALAAPV